MVKNFLHRRLMRIIRLLIMIQCHVYRKSIGIHDQDERVQQVTSIDIVQQVVSIVEEVQQLFTKVQK